MAVKIDRGELIQRLDPIKYERSDADEDGQLEQMGLAGVLLALTDINHESEYRICRTVAQHLLGRVEDPKDINLD